MRRIGLSLLLVTLVTAPVGAINQDIVDEAESIITKYKAGDLPGAIDAARLTETWLLEEQAGGLPEVFREYLNFNLELDESASASSAMLGGGITAGATYSLDDFWVKVTIVANSQMFSMVSSMMSNTMIASASGMKIIKVHDDLKGGVKQDGDETTVTVAFKGGTLVEGKGNDKEHTVGVIKNLDWPGLGKKVASP